MLHNHQSYKLYSNYLTNKFFPIEYDILFIISKYTVMPLISNDISYVSYHTKCSNINAVVYLTRSHGDKIYTVKKVLNKHL
jgi:hypothetical protein